MAERIAVFCDTHRVWMLALFSGLYLSIVGLIAARKPLENDELFTYNIAKLPTMGDVWSALMTGAEQLPPFFYVLTRASFSLLGENNFALRFPAMLGFWVMSLCLFRFVSRRSSTLDGLAAMLFPLTTAAYYYAFEARPYGLVLGFTGLALICWQTLAEEKSRVAPLAGFALGLAGAIACHYYAILIVVPFAIGEAARMYARRRVDVPVWASMAASFTPLLVSFPLIQSARSYSNGFWAQPSWGDIPGFYYFMMMSAALPLTAILIFTAIWPENARKSDEASATGLLRVETATAIGFLILPAIAVSMAMLVTRAYTHRYVLSAVLGLGILLPFAFRRVMSGRKTLALFVILALALGFARRGGMTIGDSMKKTRSMQNTAKLIEAARERDLPVVCSDQHLFLKLSHYAPADVRRRLVYLADPEASMRYLGHNSLERGMLDLLKPWFRLNVQEYRSFVAAGRPFLLCGDPANFLNWSLTELTSSDAQIDFRGRNQEILLFLVKSKVDVGGKAAKHGE
jgi:hypothetical protein